jgi:hypothetical protein
MVDARKYLRESGRFITKADLKESGPIRRVIASVTEVLKSWDGKPPVPEPVLVLDDKSKLAVRQAVNLKRLMTAFGPETEDWPGHEIEIYYSGEVMGPGGIVGGIRIKPLAPDGSAVLFKSDLDDSDDSTDDDRPPF